MLFDPKTRQAQVDQALSEAKKVLAEYEHHDANVRPQVNLIKEYGQEPEKFTDWWRFLLGMRVIESLRPF